uniref:Uncharacterized protein n=1 Tax=Globodera rostochiensis TaxID=31243 RepID=A0A914I6K2_GLORO
MRSFWRVNTASRTRANRCTASFVVVCSFLQKESIKCELHADGLCITGMKTTGDGKRAIPIVVKKAVEQE